MLTTPEPIEDDRLVAKCYVELGDVTKEKGEYEESLRYHRKSLEIYERIDDALSVADSHLNMAEVYKAKGELKRAMSEYEKGLTLYEDVYVEDTNKSSDSGADASLNSSSFSDLQHTKSLSKSDETLPQTTMTDMVEKDTPISSPVHPVDGAMNISTSSLDRFDSSTKKGSEFEDIPQFTTSIDDFSFVPTEKVGNELVKSLSSSNISDLQYVIDNDMLLPLTSPELVYDTTVETNAPFVPPLDSIKQDLLLLTNPSLLDTKLKESDDMNQLTDIQENAVSNNTKQIDNTHRMWYRLPKKQILIIILSVFLAGALFWSLYNIPFEFLLSCSSSDFPVHQNSPTYNHDDLSEQLKSFLTWRKDRIASLNKDERQVIKAFLTNPDSQSQTTMDQFQEILDLLDLKIVLIPR